ncbi:MAG: CBS domain-containing protein [Bacteriovoracaceae bacterium]
MLDIEVLKKISIEEYTTPCPITAQKDDLLASIIEKMEADGIRHIPVVLNNKPVGIVTERDILKNISRSVEAELKVEDVMTHNPKTIGTATSLDEAAYEMSLNKIGSMVVVDDHGEVFGIFTTTDALNALIEIVRGEVDL